MSRIKFRFAFLARFDNAMLHYVVSRCIQLYDSLFMHVVHGLTAPWFDIYEIFICF
jgi:hypothetical protein